MPTAQNVELMPGQDSLDHGKKERQNIAASVSQMTGQQVGASHLIPQDQQPPMFEDNLLGEVKSETSWQQKIFGKKEGEVPAGNFFSRWFKRQKKQHPNSSIQQKEE